MSQKSIASVLLLVAAALGGPVAVDQATKIQDEVATSVAIVGPDHAVVGELVELEISGARPSWLVPTSDYRVHDDVVYVSFRNDGEYEIIGSAVAGRSTQVVKHTITVGPDRSVVVPDEPVPAPVPEPTPEPIQKTSNLTDMVVKWCEEVSAPKVACKELGNNFITAATNADSIDDLLSRVSSANRKVNQKGCESVLAQIQQYLFDNLQGESLEDHRCAFDEIGQGFLQYAGDVQVDTGSTWDGI